MPNSTSRASVCADDFLSFVNASPSPFHAVHSARQRFEAAGFTKIEERDNWSSKLEPGKKYYLTRNASTIIAFAIGEKWSPGNPIAMIGAHTDSPCLRVKPVSRKQADGYLQVGVETYGGGLWHTWFDRDLSVAGRAMVRGKDGTIIHKVVRLDRPILRIPSLAIHLERQEPFEFNKEGQLFPIAGMAAAELNRQGKGPDAEAGEKDKTSEGSKTEEPLRSTLERHHPYVTELIAEQAGVAADDVLDFELVLYDTQNACIGGLNDELIYSARLDNLMMSFCAVQGLLESLSSQNSLKDESCIRLVACFDHEEIGSTSASGADSNILPAFIRRLSVLPSKNNSEVSPTAYEETLSTSFLVSADMGHAVHPNYGHKYESNHRPEMNKGTVIKVHANQSYATNGPGIVLLEEVARRAKSATLQKKAGQQSGVPLQIFVSRNDTSCGSTIGPMLSASLGSRTLDLGNPQLSMHSIRETCGAYDVEHAINLFESFFHNYSELEKKIIVD